MQHKNVVQTLPPPYISTLAGGISGALGASITCPLEVLKTRLQSHNYTRNKFDGVLHIHRSLKNIYGMEGMSGLWRGLGTTLIGVVPSRASYFGVYSFLKQKLTPEKHSETPLIHFTSAALAGIVSNTLTNPIWMVKTRLQLNTKDSIGTIRTATNIIKNEGVLSLWNGLSASYLGIFETCIQWVLYEKMKSLYCENYNVSNQDINPMVLFSFSCMSKLSATTLWYPHEVLRTRMRESSTSNHQSLQKCFTSILKNEGVSKLYSGMGVHLLRVVPNSAITILSFELLMRTFSSIYASTRIP